jgi:hypothetical protein
MQNKLFNYFYITGNLFTLLLHNFFYFDYEINFF